MSKEVWIKRNFATELILYLLGWQERCHDCVSFGQYTTFTKTAVRSEWN